jgi:hypothetical protein
MLPEKWRTLEFDTISVLADRDGTISVSTSSGGEMMANMSYCRFENTLADLEDCYHHIHAEVSAEEERARAALIRLCTRIAEEHGDEIAD